MHCHPSLTLHSYEPSLLLPCDGRSSEEKRKGPNPWEHKEGPSQSKSPQSWYSCLRERLPSTLHVKRKPISSTQFKASPGKDCERPYLKKKKKITK
jgi:hypothetical protein